MPASRLITYHNSRAKGSAMRLLDLVRRQKVDVKVAGDVLEVTMPGTDFRITYEKTDDGRALSGRFKLSIHTCERLSRSGHRAVRLTDFLQSPSNRGKVIVEGHFKRVNE
jgi:hypothetical protein